MLDHSVATALLQLNAVSSANLKIMYSINAIACRPLIIQQDSKCAPNDISKKHFTYLHKAASFVLIQLIANYTVV